MSGTWGGGKKHMSQSHKPQKQENIPQLCVCMCGYVHKCVCVLQLWTPSQAVSFRKKGRKKKKGGGEKEMERSCNICYNH